MEDPFYELKLEALSEPVSWAKSSLAQLLRVKGEPEHAPEHLAEAADYFRLLLAQIDSDSNRMHLILTLVDLSVYEPSHYAELEALLSNSRTCASTLYTKALVLFRKHGSTTESRAAMKVALDANPYVVQTLGSGFDVDDVPNHFTYGSEAEALGYSLEASHQWAATPGAMEFIIDVMARSLPAS